VGRLSKTARVSKRLTSQFQRDIFAAALKSFEQLDNPLRVNNFATGLRELSRILLAELAPNESVRACVWYTEALNKDGAVVITRAQRVQYAVQAGLPEDFVKNTLQVDVKATIDEFTQLIKHFNELTHITESAFGTSKTAAKALANQSLEFFISLFETIDECRQQVLTELESHANDAITEELMSTSVEALDEIATHHTVNGAGIEHLRIVQMDSETLVFKAKGFVDCELQYGSDGDFSRGDGVRHDDSYPLSCELVADISTPLKLEVQNLHVDNSSFYE
jgi:hypothetical protein